MKNPATSRTRRVSIALLAVLMVSLSVQGWWERGHRQITLAAVKLLPDDVPAFFRDGGTALALYSVEPDRRKNHGLKALPDTERPEHFFDIELLKGNPIPRTRGAYYALCRKLKIDPHKAGTLPYAIEENYEKLVVAFAQHRRDPGNEAVRALVLVTAGILAHYAADLSQPLHATLHYDGMAREDGTSPKTGIHARVDALPGRAGLTAREIAEGATAAALDDVFAATVAALKRSNAQVGRTYALKDKLPTLKAKDGVPIDPALRVFLLRRTRAGARLTASLWLTAWRASAKIKLRPPAPRIPAKVWPR